MTLAERLAAIDRARARLAMVPGLDDFLLAEVWAAFEADFEAEPPSKEPPTEEPPRR